MSLLSVLMKRDGLTKEEALAQIANCRADLMDRIASGDNLGAMDICEEYFSLEPDYLMDLL